MRRLVLLAVCVAVGLGTAGTAFAVTGDSPETALDAVLNNTVSTTTQKYKATDTTNTCTSMGHIVWFKWVATETGTVHASTFGSGYDTVLVVYDNNLSQIGCDDDYTFGDPCPTPKGNQTPQDHCSFVDNISVTEGQTYYFAVGAFSDSRGGKVSFFLGD
jgi:hypothetical protein